MNMRKTLTAVIAAAVFVCSNTVAANADYSEERCEKDYRKQPIYDVYGNEVTKPVANFKIKRLRNGELMDEIISDGGYDLGAPFPTMQCYVGDTITFEDLSDPTDGNGISVWDFQYFGTLGDNWNEYRYGGWSVELPDSSIERTGDERPVSVALSGDIPIKYLNGRSSYYGGNDRTQCKR